MITNHELVIEYLAKWLAEYAKTSGRHRFIVGFRGTRADALLIRICSEARRYNGEVTTKVHSCAIGFNVATIFDGGFSRMHYDNSESFYLACHRLAEEHKGLIPGPVDRTFGLYYRSYGKRAEGSADIFPIFDLEYHEIVDITSKLWPAHFDWEDEQCQVYDLDRDKDIDFCAEAERLYGIITSDIMPNKHPRWPYFISSQKEIIAHVHQREKATRHKKIDRPYPLLSDKSQLISGRV
jgi:hypothetical protein